MSRRSRKLKNAKLVNGCEGQSSRIATCSSPAGDFTQSKRNATCSSPGGNSTESNRNVTCPSPADDSNHVTLDLLPSVRLTRIPTFPNGTKAEIIKGHRNYFKRFWTTASEKEYKLKRFTFIRPLGSKYEIKCFTERSCPVCNVFLTQRDFAKNVTSKLHKEYKHRQVTNKRLELERLDRCVYVTGYPLEAAKDEKIVIGELVGELFYFGAVDAVVGLNHLQQDAVIVEFQTRRYAFEAARSVELYYGTTKMELTQIDVQEELFEVKSATVQKALNKLYSDANSAVTAEERKRALVDVANMAAVPDDELEDKKRIMREIESLLGQFYPLVTCTMFGSSVSGLGIRGTDVDAFVDLGPYRRLGLKEDLSKEDQWARIVYEKLKDARAYEMVKAITGCRVPIVTFTDIRTDIEVDLAFSGQQGIYNTKLLKFYTELHPIIKPYLMLLRLWGRGANIAQAKQPRTHLTNYAFTMLGLFFLMGKAEDTDECDGKRIKMLPSIEELRKVPYNQVIIDGHDYGFEERVSAHQPVHCPYAYPSDLVSKFFSFYSRLRFEDFILCPFNGKIIRKTSLPENYLSPKFADNKICLQDPFDHSFNTTKNIKSPGLWRFKDSCQKGIQHLENVLHKGADMAKIFLSSWFDETIDLNDNEWYVFDGCMYSSDGCILND